ncbi:hypothetical protein JTE90_024752 [Oedothorax gibbosus]|uniref:Helitron helicase-like domain-containing protein n=1 Tax=Oedothorax gibbosus TaxID=931172 RepID=A0AAV6U9W0_9ARAC|nr:hypothetical protein JTE90_024752 [Oedothorax gibbosus]
MIKNRRFLPVDQITVCIETLISGEEGLRMTPAEGYRPVSVLTDRDSPFLAFLQLFGGERLAAMHIVTKKELSKSEINKSILRRRDRQAAESTEFILFAAKVLEINRITSNHSICLRKRYGERVVTAQLASNKEYVDGVLQDDNAFRVIHGVRNSSHHWHQEGLRVRAMVRQFGLPHIFLTISAAEIKWMELIVILKKVLYGETISEEQAREISDQDKATLIQRDPIVPVTSIIDFIPCSKPLNLLKDLLATDKFYTTFIRSSFNTEDHHTST